MNKTITPLEQKTVFEGRAHMSFDISLGVVRSKWDGKEVLTDAIEIKFPDEPKPVVISISCARNLGLILQETADYVSAVEWKRTFGQKLLDHNKARDEVNRVASK
jgi:hypothetical protein